MKNRTKKFLDQASTFESLRKFLLFASHKTEDESKKKKFLLNAEICKGMAQVCTTLASISEGETR